MTDRGTGADGDTTPEARSLMRDGNGVEGRLPMTNRMNRDPVVFG